MKSCIHFHYCKNPGVLSAVLVNFYFCYRSLTNKFKPFGSRISPLCGKITKCKISGRFVSRIYYVVPLLFPHDSIFSAVSIFNWASTSSIRDIWLQGIQKLEKISVSGKLIMTL